MIITQFLVQLEKGKRRNQREYQIWIFGKADWEKFRELTKEAMERIDLSKEVDEINEQFILTVIMAAESSIPKSRNRMERRLVPWWTEECHQAVRNRNKAFKLVKKTHNLQHMIQYKKAEALVRRTIRKAKRACWRNFCDKIGRTTLVGEIWGRIQKEWGETEGIGNTQL